MLLPGSRIQHPLRHPDRSKRGATKIRHPDRSEAEWRDLLFQAEPG